jgi:flagellar basal-body rod protein FlgF
MDVKSTVLLSGEMALRRRLDVVANNIANMNTTGFKREAPVFHSYVEKMKDAPVPAAGARQLSYVLDYGTVHDTSAGAFKATGNPFDFMINGEGYFAVQLADGGTAYTRNGHFELSPEGVLVDAEGRQVLSAEGQAIQIDPAQRARVSVAGNGAIQGPDGEIARIGVTRFADEAFVEQRGDGLFNGQNGTVVAGDTVVLKVGGLEGSNVNGVVETADLVEVQRRYQTSRNMTEGLNELRKTAISRLGRAE